MDAPYQPTHRLRNLFIIQRHCDNDMVNTHDYKTTHLVLPFCLVYYCTVARKQTVFYATKLYRMLLQHTRPNHLQRGGRTIIIRQPNMGVQGATLYFSIIIPVGILAFRTHHTPTHTHQPTTRIHTRIHIPSSQRRWVRASTRRVPPSP